MRARAREDYTTVLSRARILMKNPKQLSVVVTGTGFMASRGASAPVAFAFLPQVRANCGLEDAINALVAALDCQHQLIVCTHPILTRVRAHNGKRVRTERAKDNEMTKDESWPAKRR